MNAGGELWSASALGSRPTSASIYWTSLSGAKFRGWTLRQVLKCGERTIGPYRRLITRHELGGWNVVSDAHEQAQTDARQGGANLMFLRG